MQLIELSQGLDTKVDDDLYNWLNQCNWHAVVYENQSYAASWTRYDTSGKRRSLRMQNVILGVDPQELMIKGLIVDHEDRDGLNNQKYNLRIVTRSINSYNSRHSDNAQFIHWDGYRGRYKVVYPNRKFIAW
jgi:HNH endonuclease